MKIKLFLTAATFAIVAASCVTPEERIAEQKAIIADTLLSPYQLNQIIPSPGEILYAIQYQEMDYMPDLVHYIQPPSQFPLFRAQAMIQGVYLADFSYLLLFEKQSEAIQYLYLIQEFSAVLGIEDYFDDNFFNNLLASLNKPDSLRLLSIEHSALFFQQMERTGNEELMLLVTAGTIIEVAYIASQILDEKSITDASIDLISDLSVVFETFFIYYNLTSNLDKSEDQLFADLKEMKSVFDSMKISRATTPTRKGDELFLSSKRSHSIAEYNVNKLKVHIDVVRSRVINQKY